MAESERCQVEGRSRRGGIAPQPLFAVGAVLLGSFLANFDSRLTSVGLPDLRGAFSLELRRGRLALDRGDRLADLHCARGGLARDRVRPAPHARHSEPGLCADLAADPVRPRLHHADRAQHRARPAARHLRSGDADDHLPQPADPMVAAGDRDLFHPGRLRAGYQHVAGRLLCRASRLAVAVLAGRGDRAADGADGLARHAARSRPTATLLRECRLGRHAAARRRRLDDLCGPRPGQSAGLAGIRHGHRRC